MLHASTLPLPVTAQMNGASLPSCPPILAVSCNVCYVLHTMFTVPTVVDHMTWMPVMKLSKLAQPQASVVPRGRFTVTSTMAMALLPNVTPLSGKAGSKPSQMANHPKEADILLTLTHTSASSETSPSRRKTRRSSVRLVPPATTVASPVIWQVTATSPRGTARSSRGSTELVSLPLSTRVSTTRPKSSRRS